MNARCIFCKADSTLSKSVEHIVPSSLWNTKHILPRGVVCDACNNYFSRKVEKPFLDSAAVIQLRFDEAIPNKRNRIPPSSGILLPDIPVTARRHLEGPHPMTLEAPPEAIAHILSAPSSTIIFPCVGLPPEERVVSRFLAKMAVEAVAHKLLPHAGGLEYLVNEVQLDPIRNFARRGQPDQWPHHCRRIYKADRAISDLDGNLLQTVHEFDFLVTPGDEWYFIFALFGLEFAINLGGAEIDGYVSWLQTNGGVSPLYHGKNAPQVAD